MTKGQTMHTLPGPSQFPTTRWTLVVAAAPQQWRSTHKRRGRIPETLWAEAAELARQHGIYQTARTLRLEYTRLWYWSQQRREPAGQAVDEGTSLVPQNSWS